MRIEAKQQPPEWTQSPLDYSTLDNAMRDCWPDISLCGNRRYNEHKTEAMQDAERATTDAAEEWSNGKEWTGEPVTITQALEDFQIVKHNGKRWTPRELGEWKRIFQDYDRNPYDGRNADRRTVAALELITGKPHDWTELRGPCQGDYIKAFYPSKEYSRDALRALEIEYFNMGEEYEATLYDDDGNEIETAWIYCYSWSEDEQKREISDAFPDTRPEDVTLRAFAGWTRSPKWA